MAPLARQIGNVFWKFLRLRKRRLSFWPRGRLRACRAREGTVPSATSSGSSELSTTVGARNHEAMRLDIALELRYIPCSHFKSF
jgi:hypothetical protein